jgi:lipopolysaccharide transport system ATP-binding protein
MITVNNLTKIFHLYKKPSDRLREIIFRGSYHRNFYALKNVSFQIAEGETLGIIGENGSGKSTLLKIITGVLMPDSGSFHIDGRITGLLELGTGFNPEFSGLHNIYMNAMYLGLSRPEIDAKLDQITHFAEIGHFIDEPIKTYSSGMLMRLAFSVAIHADPKCFVVDEALAVGDAYFQQKCMQRLKEFKANGGSIVFVSHDMNAIKMLCDQAILLDRGQVVENNDPETVINVYNFLLSKKSYGEKIQTNTEQEKFVYGNHKAVIEKVTLSGYGSDDLDVVVSGKKIYVNITIVSYEHIDQATVGIMFRDRFGQDIFGTNTYHLHHNLSLSKEQTLYISFCFDKFNLGVGKYTLTAAIHTGDSHVESCFQWIDKMKVFQVVHSADYYFEGICRLTPQVKIEQR